MPKTPDQAPAPANRPERASKTPKPDAKTREEKLAEALRANLRRRKGAKAKDDGPGDKDE